MGLLGGLGGVEGSCSHGTFLHPGPDLGALGPSVLANFFGERCTDGVWHCNEMCKGLSRQRNLKEGMGERETERGRYLGHMER